MEQQLQNALTGQASAEEALTRVAEQWNGITDRLGRDQQRDYYQATIE